MTMTEKILARHAKRSEVSAGEKIWCNVDVLMTHDVCGPGTIGIFQQEFGQNARVWDRDRIVILPDHYIFTADAKAHRNISILRDFAAHQQLPHYFDPDFIPHQPFDGKPTPYSDPTTTSYAGVCHAALPEKGFIRPGELLIGTDSHTCTAGAFGMFATGVGNTDAAFVMGTGKIWLVVPPTLKFIFNGEMPPYLMGKDLMLHVIGETGFSGATYKAMEFAGPALMSLNMDDRCTLTNMAIEAGGKNGIIEADAVTEAYVKARTDKPYQPVRSDADATCERVWEFDTATIEPLVAQPHSPDNRARAADLGDVKVDRCYIGSCTGGQCTDFLAAAMILKGQTVKVDTYLVPASTEVDHFLDTRQLDGQSLRDIFTAAGCRIGPASCAACLGGPVDTFGRANEPISVISSTNRNFPGRMGHKQAGVYLASPLTIAATALTGTITDPREFYDADHPVGLAES
jgi:3-isopropylmalate/(R)-2-methylmalate dehydratase large subunit